MRDLLLGKHPKDFDIATSATPEEVKAQFRNCRLIGRRFRLAHVYFGSELIEVATFRGQRDDTGQRLHRENGRIVRDNVWGTVEEDAVRRDFTINALFLDPDDWSIRDYVGGYQDLRQRRLRLIGDAEDRYREDPVRMLRAARFVAKLGLDLDQQARSPLFDLGGLLHDVPPARLFEEVNKLFLTGHALTSFQCLQQFGLMRHLFPVLAVQPDEVQVVETPLLTQALTNTDQRIADTQPVTPAFLYAALLWEPVRQRALEYAERGYSYHDALAVAGDQVISEQLRTVAIPRRFSTMTRQIWVMQPRFRRRIGRRAERLLFERRFRAAYDFLLLRDLQEPDLKALVKWWTHIQTLPAQEQHAALYPRQSKHKAPYRRGRRRRSKPES